MITSFNPENKVQFELYTKLFSEAYYDLYKTEGTFDSLDQYFAHMKDLVAIDNKYLMLPLDEASEAVFAINANDRTVTVPAQFNKCGAVQGDQICEIVVFSVDRYFDYQDLDMTNICVQWVNAAGEEGISHIQMKDHKTIPGKLRFGWPLTSKITKKDGNVQFAVRFYKEYNNEGEDKTYAYILNTLPANLVVKKNIGVSDANIKPENKEENVLDLFANVVANSQNPSYIIPKDPFFVNPGHDITADNYSTTKFGAAIKEDNTLTMTAQAYANDLCTINYTWKKEFVDSEGKVSIITLDADSEGYDIENPYMMPVERPAEGELVRQPGQKYWKETEDGAYVRFDGELDKDTQYYLRTTKLTITDSDTEVVGSYYVEATNIAFSESGEIINSSNKGRTSTLALPAPADIEIQEKNNLPAHKFIESADGAVQLNVTPEIDAKGPIVTYKWFGSNTKPESVEDITTEKATTKELMVSEPGWYSVLVSSALNRKVKTNEEDRRICKVTYLPAAPKAEELKFSYCYFSSGTDRDTILDQIASDEQWTVLADGDDEDTMIDKIPDVFVVGDLAILKIDTNLDDVDELESESLEYVWMVQEPGQSEPRELTKYDINANGLVYEGVDSALGNKTLVVRCLVNGAPYNYHCIIKNHIQNKSAELDTSKIYTFTIA